MSGRVRAAQQEAEAKSKAKADAEARKRKEREADKARADEVAGSFELGQSSKQAMSGMGDLLAAPARRERELVDAVRAEDAPDNPETFIQSPNGALDFGEITPEMAKAAGRQAGKIRLQRGVQNADGTGYGLAHIEANHGELKGYKHKVQTEADLAKYRQAQNSRYRQGQMVQGSKSVPLRLQLDRLIRAWKNAPRIKSLPDRLTCPYSYRPVVRRSRKMFAAKLLA